MATAPETIDNMSTLSADHAGREGESIAGSEQNKTNKTNLDQPKSPPLRTTSRASSPTTKAEFHPRFRMPSYDYLDDLYARLPPGLSSLPTAPSMQIDKPATVYSTYNHKLKIPKYDARDIERWIEVYEHICLANNCNDQMKYNQLIYAFEGTPYLDYYIKLTKAKKIRDWESAKAEFLQRTPDKDTVINFQSILQRKQKPDEDVLSYITSQENAISRLKIELPENFIVSQINQGFRYDIFKRMMETEMPNTINELIQKAVIIEQIVKAIEARKSEQKYKGKRVEFKEDYSNDHGNGRKYTPEFSGENQRRNPDNNYRFVNNQLKDIRKAINDIKFNSNRYREPQRFQERPSYQSYWNRPNVQNPESNRNNREISREPISQLEHPIRPAIEAPRTTDQTNVKRNTNGQVKCYNCQKYGHFARECALLQARERATNKPIAKSGN